MGKQFQSNLKIVYFFNILNKFWLKSDSFMILGPDHLVEDTRGLTRNTSSATHGNMVSIILRCDQCDHTLAKEPLQGVHEIYNFSKAWISFSYYYIFSLPELFPRVEKKIFKEINDRCGHALELPVGISAQGVIKFPISVMPSLIWYILIYQSPFVCLICQVVEFSFHHQLPKEIIFHITY